MTVRLTRRAFVGAAVAAPALAALPISLQSAGAQDAITVTMVTDTAGLGDQNFNDLANAGGDKGRDRSWYRMEGHRVGRHSVLRSEPDCRRRAGPA